MPSLVHIDGFEHQTLSGNGFGSNLQLYNSVTGVPTFITGREGTGSAIRFGASASVQVDMRKNNPSTHYVFSGYVRVSARPSANVLLHDCGIGGSGMGLTARTLDGRAQIGCGANTGVGPDISDNQWHLVDWYVNSGITGWIIEWMIDGVKQTPVRGNTAIVASGDAQCRLGHGATHGSVSTDWDDVVLSFTPGDYPIGPHRNRWLVPNADETHQAGTNTIEDNAGNDIGVVTAFDLLDEWPANTSDYVQQVTIGSGNWATVSFENIPTTDIVYGVQATAAMFSSGTLANNGDCRIVVPGTGATVATVYASDMSETALHYRVATVPLFNNGGGTPDMVNNLLAQVGRSTDVTDNPRWSAIGLGVCVGARVDATPPISVGGPGRP